MNSDDTQPLAQEVSSKEKVACVKVVAHQEGDTRYQQFIDSIPNPDCVFPGCIAILRIEVVSQYYSRHTEDFNTGKITVY